MLCALLCGCSSVSSVPEDYEPNRLPLDKVDELLLTVNESDSGYCLSLAKLALNDLMDHFWLDDGENYRLKRTWNGYLDDPNRNWRGSGWETAMAVFAIDDLWQITSDDTYKEMLMGEANFFRENFTFKELTAAGEEFNWASDDCAWNAMQFLVFYDVTGDEYFLDAAIALLDSTRERWYDADTDMMSYKDNVDYMSLYEVGCALSWLRIWDITGEDRFYELALASYNSMHKRLWRDDGLYYCEANTYWPLGGQYEIQECGSSGFLTGNMGMAALSAKFYRLTGDESYLKRALKTTEGLVRWYTEDGVLINDRDAWTNGAFAAFYATEVLSLPGTEQMREILKNTATSIVQNARTTDGYYGGSWSGPAEGPGSAWWTHESMPQQIMTSATSVLIVCSAALMEAGIESYWR